MSVPETVIALLRTMPPPGTIWPMERRLVFIQALDALLANHFGTSTLMIWIGADGDIHIAQREEPAASSPQNDFQGDKK